MPTRKTVVEDLGPAPTVTNISPSSYGVRGGATVTLTGTNFTSSTTVSLGGSTCGSVSFVSSTSLTCVISYHGAAVVDVVATNPDGQTGTLVNGFKYNAFLYATAGSTDRIYSFVVDSGTKAVSATTTPFLATCDYPYGVDVDPTNQFVYVACYNNSGTGKRVHWFSIDHATGNLTFVNQVTANNRQLAGIAVSPVGGYAFTGVYEATGRIQAYSMDSVTGALTWLADYTAGSLVSLVAADPLGRFVFSADNGSSSVTKYVVNTSPSFSLSNPQTLATSVATSPDGICVHPSGQYVYAAGASNPGYAVAFSVNSSDGTLTEIDVENHGANASSGSGVITDPSGSHLYITAYSANRVYGYTINPSNGTLTALGNWATGGGPNDVRIQSLGNLVVTANRTGTSVTVFSRDLGTGLLSGAVTSSIGVGPDIIAITY
ncbi:MAG: beta-propeller fold lactonase family protein [Bdellovibrionales bacterium]|nr:beta-propeller fold lactonase family protein [Bdellovibrionales bacterium]